MRSSPGPSRGGAEIACRRRGGAEMRWRPVAGRTRGEARARRTRVQAPGASRQWVGLTCSTEERPDPMLTILLVVIILLLLFGGGWGYRRRGI
jgi:hypothetical protein